MAGVAPAVGPAVGTLTPPPGLAPGVPGILVPAVGIAGGYPTLGFNVCRRTPWTGTSLDIIALPTDIGRAWLARTLAEGVAFKVVEFAVGRGGYDPSNPTQALPIDPSDTELEDEVFRDYIDDIQAPNDLAYAFLCRLEAPEALAGLGELGLWAEVTWSPIPAEIGEKFMIVLAHFPMRVKTRRHVEGFRVICQF